MRLIIGGRGQGKLEALLKEQKYTDTMVCQGETCPLDRLIEQPVLNHLHLLVRRWLAEGREPMELSALLLQNDHLEVILCDEIGSGVVPMDRQEEQWREATGRICCLLAEKAQQVDRVFCGIKTRIKG